MLSAYDAAAEIRKRGATLLRSVLDADRLSAVGGRITSGEFVNRPVVEWTGLQDEVFDLAQIVAKSSVVDVVRRYFGGYAILPMTAIALRYTSARHDPYADLPFHQDAYAFPGGWEILTCWVLLDPPTLTERHGRVEILRDCINERLPIDPAPESIGYKWMEADRSKIANLGQAGDLWQPLPQIGDALLFHQFTPHRTLTGPDVLPRLSVDLRFIADTPEHRDEYRSNGHPIILV